MNNLIESTQIWATKIKQVSRWFAVSIILFALGCGDSELAVTDGSIAGDEFLTYNESSGDGAFCANPVAVSGEPSDTSVGYVVEIESSVDVFTASVNLIDNYSDVDVLSVSENCNCMHVSSSDTTMEQIRCEPSVTGLSYDFDQL